MGVVMVTSPFLNFAVCCDAARRTALSATADPCSKWRPSAILYFERLELIAMYTVHRINVRHCTKFRADLSNRYRDMAISFIYFSKWRLSRLAMRMFLQSATSILWY